MTTLFGPVEWLLAAAACFNLVIGGAGLLGRSSTLEGRIVGLLVLCFGGVYGLVAIDVARFAPMLWAGVVGKLGVIALMVPAVARGAVPKAVGPVLLGDALFTGAFLVILLKG